MIDDVFFMATRVNTIAGMKFVDLATVAANSAALTAILEVEVPDVEMDESPEEMFDIIKSRLSKERMDELEGLLMIIANPLVIGAMIECARGEDTSVEDFLRKIIYGTYRYYLSLLGSVVEQSPDLDVWGEVLNGIE